MANQSIKAAFERLWHHVVVKLTSYATTESLDTHIADTSNPHGVTKEQLGLGNVDNTADANKQVAYAASAGSSTSATKATQDASGNTITSTYETKTDSSAKLTEAKEYADSVVATVKNDLLNGAGEAYDTLKELGDLIDENTNALEALESVASGKADAEHIHEITDVTELQDTITTINDTIATKSQVQIVANDVSEVLPILTIHRLTQEEYDQAVADGTFDENAIYLTPDEEIDLTDYVAYEEFENHNHDSMYDSIGSADESLTLAKTYADNAAAQKTQVQIITWEDDD